MSSPMSSPRLSVRGPIVWLLVSLAMLFVLLGAAVQYLTPSSPGRELTLSELSGLIESNRVEQATFLDEDARIEGRFTSTAVTTSSDRKQRPSVDLGGSVDAAPEGEGAFFVAYPKSGSSTGALLTALTSAGAQVEVDAQPGKVMVRMLTTVVLPLLILANLFALLFSLSRGGGGVGEIRSFGTLGRRGSSQVEPPSTRFSEVAGADEAVTELSEVVSFLKDPAAYAAMGAVPPKGVLLYGSPGCGKTLIARATAGEAQVPFFSVAGAEFVESLVGVGAARIRDLFAKARAVAPAIVFIDEIDAAGRRRGGGDGGGSDEREQTLNQLLVEMDGFDAASGIVVMGATNRPDILDPALLRPGRFDRHVVVEQPDVAGRERILRLHANDKPISSDVDLTAVARRTPGFTGADLANVVNEAALLAIRERKTNIDTPEFTEAVQRVIAGPQRRGRLLDATERHRIAVHEAGHALVVSATGRVADIHRISVVTRGRALGSLALGSDRDAVLLTQDQLQAQLASAMSGRAAEELVFGAPSTGSEADLEHATNLARDIVARYGMSQRLGRMRLLDHDADAYLGSAPGLQRLSGPFHEQVDTEVRRLLEEAFHQATAILETHRALLDEIVAELLEAETLEGPSLEMLLHRAAAPTPPDPRPSGQPLPQG